MARKTEQTLDPRLRDLLVIGMITMAAFIMIALISYHPSDPSWNTLANTQGVHNWGGVVGAHIADILLQLFGMVSFSIPLVLLGLSFTFFRPIHVRQLIHLGISFLLWMTCASAIVACFQKPLSNLLHSVSWHDVPGGAVGAVISSLAIKYLNPIGAQLILWAALIAIIYFGFGIALHRLGWQLGSHSGNLLKNMGAQAGRGWEHGITRIKQWAQELKQLKPKLQPKIDNPRPVAKTPQLRVVKQDQEPRIRKPLASSTQASGNPAAKAPRKGTFRLPSLDLLAAVSENNSKVQWDKEQLLSNARMLEAKLKDFSVEGQVVEVQPGPIVTTYEFAPAPGIKVQRIVNLEDDLALALKALSIRIMAPIPGKSAVGIEVPNPTRESVSLREVVEHDNFQNSDAALTLALGKDVAGVPAFTDLAKMPHLLVAGATGAGKSVGINVMLTSILLRNTPDQVRLLLVDPKMLELSTYDGLPHLLHPVVTDPKAAAKALRWTVREMERRYRLLAEHGVRNINGFNKMLEEGNDHDPALQPLPHIVVVIDELADLMMVAAREVEESIARLAQMARASGIHMILATQRPSVDVITGLIKANLPARISFQVSSKIDSRTILDASGAETLLGAGDMLFMPPGTSKLMRIHGAYISDKEIKDVCDFVRQQGQAEYDESITQGADPENGELDPDEMDEKYHEAIEIVLESRQASISMLQRKMRIGYNRAARMIDMMEIQGIVAPAEGSKPREVLSR